MHEFVCVHIHDYELMMNIFECVNMVMREREGGRERERERG